MRSMVLYIVGITALGVLVPAGGGWAGTSPTPGVTVIQPTSATIADTTTEESVKPGVTYIKRTVASASCESTFFYHLCRIDLTEPSIQLRVATGNDHLNDKGPTSSETTSSIAKRYGAVVAINTDYFGMPTTYPTPGDPHGAEGLTCMDGGQKRAATRRSGINIAPDGRTVTIAMQSELAKQTDLFNCTGGGPTYIVNGGFVCDVSHTGTEDIINGEHFARGLAAAWVKDGSQPNTSVALTQDGKTLLLVVADVGQCGVRSGPGDPTMYDFLRYYGAYTGIQCDNGGSTTMAINGTMVNNPCDGYCNERRIAAVLMVMSEADED